MKKSEKALFIENLTAELKGSNSLVVIDYIGLSVKRQQELKKRLKVSGAKMLVVKNTLLKRAGESANISKEILSDTVLKGPTAIIISESDPIAALQILSKFAQEFEIPQFKVGIIEGKFFDKENLIKLSNLPSKEVLYSQTVGAISSPISSLLSVLQGNLQKLLIILNQAST
jgi:large subunit ribosomal protein L10